MAQTTGANVGKGATVRVNIDKEGASGVKKKNYKWRVVSGDGTVVDVRWRTSAHKGLVLKTWCTEPPWSLGSNSTDKHGQHETKCHCKQRHNPCSLQDASPLRTGSRKASSQVSSFPMASWKVCLLASRLRSSSMLAEVKLCLIAVLRPHQQRVLHLQAFYRYFAGFLLVYLLFICCFYRFICYLCHSVLCHSVFRTCINILCINILVLFSFSITCDCLLPSRLKSFKSKLG